MQTNKEKFNQAINLLIEVCENWNEEEIDSYSLPTSFDEFISDLASKVSFKPREEIVINKVDGRYFVSIDNIDTKTFRFDGEIYFKGMTGMREVSHIESDDFASMSSLEEDKITEIVASHYYEIGLMKEGETIRFDYR